ncbi:MAG: cytochrome c oxidase subunit II [Pseudomonadales bacterium]|nr:cytochrome c oxidase subunit II [Pseudomonadales bacterium]
MPWFRLVVGAMLLSSSSAWAEWTVNMTPGVTAISREIYSLHMIIFWICVVIGVVVFGVMFWSVFAHRKSKGAKPAQFHESTTVELIWTTIPFVILIAMAIPATKTLVKIYDSKESVIDVKITASQWKWRYDYLNDGFGYFSNLRTAQDEIYNKAPKGDHYLLEVDEPLVLPVNTKVRFLITASDVIHSWWVPALAVKKDAIPGFVNESWTIIDEPGIYRGQCAELCGKDHGFMPIVVIAKEQAEYDAWVASRKTAAAQENELKGKELSKDELMERGGKTYATFCAACHNLEGTGTPPVFPALKGSAIALGDKNAHINLVLNGKAGTAMAAFGAQLSEVDLAAVITYERNAWGNDTGDVIQPAEIAKLKAAQ